MPAAIPSTAADAPSPLPRPTSPRDLFVTFTLMALQGFGGVLAVAQRTLCEHKRWLTHDEFVELLAVAQVLPGPNVVNLAILVGDRFLGARGAAAALGGMILVPLVIVLSLTALYAGFAHLPAVAGALRGMAAVSAGLIFGTALKLAGSLRTSPLGPATCALVGAATFALVAWLRLPLLWVIAAAGSVSMLLAWRTLRAARRAGGSR
ncbi:MAG: chromate transporter [Burkholderiaceae bacterium]|nr:chromate transporter [Burkholderiaceae bacterium]